MVAFLDPILGGEQTSRIGEITSKSSPQSLTTIIFWRPHSSGEERTQRLVAERDIERHP